MTTSDKDQTPVAPETNQAPNIDTGELVSQIVSALKEVLKPAETPQATVTPLAAESKDFSPLLSGLILKAYNVPAELQAVLPSDPAKALEFVQTEQYKTLVAALEFKNTPQAPDKAPEAPEAPVAPETDNTPQAPEAQDKEPPSANPAPKTFADIKDMTAYMADLLKGEI